MQQIHTQKQNQKVLFMEHFLIYESKMVQRVGKNLNLIRDETIRWRDILEVPYQEYLVSR